MSNNNSIITTIIGTAGLIGIIYGYTVHKRLTKISAKLDKTIDDLADDVDVDISEDLVNKAVNKAVAIAVKEAIDKATSEAVSEVRRDIHREVSAAVNKEYEFIKDSVLKETTISASQIDVAKVTKDVEKAAEKLALEKFDAKLEDIAEKFSNDMDNTVKVISAIKAAMNPVTTNGREFVVKLG